MGPRMWCHNWRIIPSDNSWMQDGSRTPSRNWPWKSMKVHGHSWDLMVKRMDFHVSPCRIINVYEKCCVLTTWKFIDFHVNPPLATNGNEQFVWAQAAIHQLTMSICGRERLLPGTHPVQEFLLTQGDRMGPNFSALKQCKDRSGLLIYMYPL